MKAALYTRVSTDMQKERGDSLADQSSRLKKYAEIKGWEIAEVYTDAGISAADTDRPAFQKMCRDVEAGGAEVVLCTKLDRMFRNTKDFLNGTDYFEKHDVKFVCLDGDIDTTTAAGRVFSTMRAAFAQFERETTAERVRAVMSSRATSGKWNGGQAPYGYMSHATLVKRYTRDGFDQQTARTKAFKLLPAEKKLFIYSEEAEVVREIYKFYLKTNSIRATTIELTRRGVRTRDGGMWAKESIKRILTNPIYIGTQIYGKRTRGLGDGRLKKSSHAIRVEGVCEPIIEEVDFEKVQSTIQAQANVYPRTKKSDHLLTGIVTCGHCGANMAGHSMPRREHLGGRLRYYRCYANVQKGTAACKGTAVRADLLEDVVVGHIKQFCVNKQDFEEGVEAYRKQYEKEVIPLQKQLLRLEKELGVFDERKDRLFYVMETGKISLKEFSKRKKSLDQEREELEKKISELKAQLDANRLGSVDLEAIYQAVRTVGDVFERLTFEEKRTAIRCLIDDIRVDNGKAWIALATQAHQMIDLPKDTTTPVFIQTRTGMDSSRRRGRSGTDR